MEHKILDHKAAKMLEIYAEERFKDGRSAQRLRLQLVLWVLRMKVLGSLKRLLDFSVAAVMLLLLSPLMGITALLVKWTSPGTIFFGQTRVGKYGTHFTCYKFRTMRLGTGEHQTHEVAADAVMKIGSLLRKTKIDELPQAWNILRRELSLVGPRPSLPSQSRLIEERRKRGVLSVRPGITGLAQINGIDMRDPVELARWDTRYIAQQSLLTDIRIIFATLIGRGQGDQVKPES